MVTPSNRFFKYLVANSSDKEWGFYITDAGSSHIRPHSHYPPSGHPSEYDFSPNEGRILHTFQIVFISRGKGYFESKNGGKYTIQDGDLFLLFPNEWHRYWPDKKVGWDEHWVGYDGFYARHLCEKKFLDVKSPVISVGYDNNFVALFNEIIEIVQKEPLGFQKTLSAKTLQMIARLNTLKHFPAHEKQYIHEVINIAKYTLAEKLNWEFDFEQFARNHGVSYSWFRQSFKSFTGFSPHQYVLELRMTRAKKLLSETGLSIKQISYDLGFDTPFYFSRIFKKKTGHSPSEWRMYLKANY